MHRRAHATLRMLTEDGQTEFLARYLNAPFFFFFFLVDVDLISHCLVIALVVHVE
jgi:hypothetical protein